AQSDNGSPVDGCLPPWLTNVQEVTGWLDCIAPSELPRALANHVRSGAIDINAHPDDCEANCRHTVAIRVLALRMAEAVGMRIVPLRLVEDSPPAARPDWAAYLWHAASRLEQNPTPQNYARWLASLIRRSYEELARKGIQRIDEPLSGSVPIS